jgi:hypothetical protein
VICVCCASSGPRAPGEDKCGRIQCWLKEILNFNSSDTFLLMWFFLKNYSTLQQQQKTNGPVDILPFYEQFYDQSLDETPQKQYG